MSGRGVRLGVVILPEYPWPEGVRIWRRVEELGAAHAWTFDHLSWRLLRDQPWFDAMTTLAAAAGTTERMELGTLVASPNFRHPLPTAKAVMTLDHLSGGRFVFGVGAGAAGADSTALGGQPLSPVDRAARFEEFVELTDRLLRHPRTSFRGRFYAAVDARVVPGCVRRPRVPFAVAASGPRGMRLAARHAATWITIGRAGTPGEQTEGAALATLREQVDRLAAACEETGRDFGDLRRLVNLSRIVVDPYRSGERLADLLGRCGELGFTDAVVNYPRRDGIFAGDPAVFERAVAHVSDSVHVPGSC